MKLDMCVCVCFFMTRNPDLYIYFWHSRTLKTPCRIQKQHYVFDFVCELKKEVRQLAGLVKKLTSRKKKSGRIWQLAASTKSSSNVAGKQHHLQGETRVWIAPLYVLIASVSFGILVYLFFYCFCRTRQAKTILFKSISICAVYGLVFLPRCSCFLSFRGVFLC